MANRRTDPQRELEREHQARTLQTRAGLEPRPSAHDEQAIADRARVTGQRELRRDLVQAFREIDRALTHIESNLGRVAPGDHRDRVKAARRVMRSLRSVVDQVDS